MNRRPLYKNSTVFALAVGAAGLFDQSPASAGPWTGRYLQGHSGSECHAVSASDAACLLRSEIYGVANSCTHPVQVICPVWHQWQFEANFTSVADDLRAYIFDRSSTDSFTCTFYKVNGDGGSYNYDTQNTGLGSFASQSSRMLIFGMADAITSNATSLLLSCAIPRYDATNGYSHLANYESKFEKYAYP